MKHILPLLTLTCVVLHTTAQNVDFYGNALSKDICSTYGMKDDKEAKACLDKICDAADIPDNFVLAPCANIDNCFALYKNGYSYIVYDINFFNKVKTFGFTSKNLPKENIDWAALTILAHEIGHHMCLHTTNPNLASIYTPVQIELQADEYAGSIMYRLGATLAQAQLAMNSNDVPDQATLTHPARKDRLDAIAKGWNKEFAKNPARNGQAAGNAQGGPATDISGNAAANPADALKDMILVEGGTFKMGTDDGTSNGVPMHTVAVGSFYISKYEVTQTQWQAVMGLNRSIHKCDNCPVEDITYDEALAYCQKMSALTGKTWRLPTEAEWEYAARGGKKSVGYPYSGSDNVDEVGWCDSNAHGQTQPIGQKKANELGLYDMAGNVWEWCSDWYDAGYYQTSPALNPQGMASGLYKTVRGGSCSQTPVYLQSTFRGHADPTKRGGGIGFRPVVVQ